MVHICRCGLVLVQFVLLLKRVEERELLEAVERGEAREKRLKRIMMIKLIWEKKLAAKNLSKMFRMLEQLSLEDLDIEVDNIELKAIDMMELEEYDDQPNDPVDMMYEDTLELGLEQDGVKSMPIFTTGEENKTFTSILNYYQPQTPIYLGGG